MKIGLYQFNPVFGNIDKNLNKIAKALKGCDADLIVLPELCTTGYQLSRDQVKDFGEEIPNGHTVAFLSDLCQKGGFHVIAGLAERDGSKIYNSAALVGPDGWKGTYRKVHLFNVEKTLFTPGDRGFQVWGVGQAKLGIMICFDWLFPESVRTLALKGADIICHPANLVLPYCQAAMVTRSIENRVYTITANRVGYEQKWDEPLTFTGMSQITSPSGEKLVQCETSSESLEIIEIDLMPSRNKMITPKNHVLNDRRPEFYTSDE